MDRWKSKNRRKKMKRIKFTAALLAMVIALSGCTETIGDNLSDSSENTMHSSTESTSTTGQPASTGESTVNPDTSRPMGVKVEKPASLTSLDEVIIESPVGNIEVCSVKQALNRFDEISSKTPEGTPEEIVKTLMERNVLCFAIMYGKCWKQDGNGYGIKYDSTEPRYIPIESDYIKSVEQLWDLFGGTYNEDETSRLLYPYDVYDYCDTFFYENGKLYYDLDQLCAFHGDSFAEPTRAVIVSANKDEIIFGRLNDENPTGEQPNNFLFKAVNTNGKWLLTTLITDAPAYSPMYTKLVTTKRAGNAEFMKFVETQVGAIGGMKYCNWYGFDFRTEWCAVFVSWAYDEFGADAPAFARCDSEGRWWFTHNGLWQDRGYADIAPGDSIFFDWDHDDSADHVGLVVGRDEKYVYTVEGNRSDTCIANKYELDCEDILGYGLINWD